MGHCSSFSPLKAWCQDVGLGLITLAGSARKAAKLSLKRQARHTLDEASHKHHCPHNPPRPVLNIRAVNMVVSMLSREAQMHLQNCPDLKYMPDSLTRESNQL